MQLLVQSDGQLHCIYSEKIDLNALGPLSIRRASHVEPDQAGQWLADLSPIGGPLLGPFSRRSEALAAELAWLNQYWLP